MKFRFAVEIEVKNDGLTQDMGQHDLAMMLLAILEDNKIASVPWVIGQHYAVVKE
jgi:predicted N-formylglutamate amidohydrolase